MIHALVASLKEAGQDHEFYPTTNEILDVVAKDMRKLHRNGHIDSILDIGAGNGKALKALRVDVSISMYAIEKSLILQQQLPAEVFVIGTEFKEQSLIEKKIDVTFCNPPYSEYEDWATKIINESASRYAYLVLPKRWANSEQIKTALTYREAKAKVLGSFSFEDAEDRAARAVVEVISVEFSNERDDAFEKFFDKEFAGLRAKFDKKRNEEEPNDKRFDKLVEAGNYAESLVACYNAEMDHIRKNYDAVAQLDADLLREFEVFPDKVKHLLRERLQNLRTTYWRELFSRIDAVTDRLCTKQRNTMLRTLNANGHVDFTLNNIYAIIIWIVKNANVHVDEQLCELFMELISKANVKNYKSNQKVFEYNRWRYEQEKPTHIALEYRLVLEHSGGIRKTEYSFEKGLEERAANLLKDICTVAKNLGFNCDTNPWQLNERQKWKSGECWPFFFRNDKGEEKPLFDVRAFYNGNMHIRLNQKLALAINVECGRLQGWLRTAQEASEELCDLTATQFFGSQQRIGQAQLPMLMPAQKL